MSQHKKLSRMTVKTQDLSKQIEKQTSHAIQIRNWKKCIIKLFMIEFYQKFTSSAADAPRALTLVLAKACSVRSARSSASASCD